MAAQTQITTLAFGSGSPASGMFLLLIVAYQNGAGFSAPSNFSLVRSTVGTTFTVDIYRATAGASEPSTYTINFTTATGLSISYFALSNVNSVLGSSGSNAIGAVPITVVPPVAVIPAGSVAINAFFSTAQLIAPNITSPLQGGNQTGFWACATSLRTVTSPLHAISMGTAALAEYTAVEIVLSPIVGQTIGLGAPGDAFISFSGAAF